MMFLRTIAVVILLCSVASVQAQTPLEGTQLTRRDLPSEEGFVARGGSVAQLVNVVAGKVGQSAIVSPKAQKKKLEGTFDLAKPSHALDLVCKDLGLIWYSDGQSLYVYDASETRSAIGRMRSASVTSLQAFLRQSNLDDERYPVRGAAGDGTFYVSGPPVYVEAVINAASYIDDIHHGVEAEATHVEIIKLNNGFIGGRRYGVRGQSEVMPGMADVLAAMMTQAQPGKVTVQAGPPAAPESTGAGEASAPLLPAAPKAAVPAPVAGMVIMAHPQSNSLLLRGTREQLRQARQLVAAMDVARQQIEMSLWIIDVKKSEVDRLGVNWSGSLAVNDYIGVSFNQDRGGITTLDGGHFLASVSALVKTGAASVVSRPVLMTQENVEAHFDSNNTFYEPLVGERVTSLEAVTYGTLISVLPRLSANGEVEMQLRIEDGAANPATGEGALPVVARTSIDTIARVPQHLSLLVGGYTRSAQEEGEDGIPGLSKLPWVGGAFRTRRNLSESIVRVYLIQPRVLGSGEAMTREEMGSRLPMPASDRLDEVSRLLPPPMSAPPVSEARTEAIPGVMTPVQEPLDGRLD